MIEIRTTDKGFEVVESTNEGTTHIRSMTKDISVNDVAFLISKLSGHCVAVVQEPRR